MLRDSHKKCLKTRKKAENSGIGAKFHCFISFFQSHPYLRPVHRARVVVLRVPEVGRRAFPRLDAVGGEGGELLHLGCFKFFS